MWSHGVVELLLCEVVCLGVRDGAAETLLTGVKVVPETTDLGKSSFGDDTAHIDDWCVFIILCVSLAFLSPLRGDLSESTARARIQTDLGSALTIYIPSAARICMGLEGWIQQWCTPEIQSAWGRPHKIRRGGRT